jgi:hypothetical protein
MREGQHLMELVGLDARGRPVLLVSERTFAPGDVQKVTRTRRYRENGTVAATALRIEPAGENESLVYRYGAHGELVSIEGRIGDDRLVESFVYRGAFRKARQPAIIFGCSRPIGISRSDWAPAQDDFAPSTKGFNAVHLPPPELPVFKGKRVSRWQRHHPGLGVTEVVSTVELEWDRTLSCENVGNNVFAYRYSYTPEGRLRLIENWTGDAVGSGAEPTTSVERTFRAERIVSERQIVDTFDFVYDDTGRLLAARAHQHEILFDLDARGRLSRRTKRRTGEPDEVTSFSYQCP